MSNSTISLLQNNIRKYRQEKGFSQLKLSVMTGLSKDYITSIECGRRVPSVKRLILIASTLGVDTYKFFM